MKTVERQVIVSEVDLLNSADYHLRPGILLSVHVAGPVSVIFNHSVGPQL
jgi:hypothetical protein